jgi:hypothetical protein
MKFARHMILNQADDLLGGGGGGGNPTPPANNGGNPPPANNGGTPPAPKADDKPWFPENWKELLPDELKNEPSIKSLKDPIALAKSYIHGQKLIGKEKIIVPDKDTSEEEWSKVWQKLGMPEDLTKYEFKAPEGADPEIVKSFKEFAPKAGILPGAAEKLFSWMTDRAQAIEAQQEETNKATFTKTVDGLKKEWGQAYDRKLSNASGLFNQFADDETKAFMRDTGFSNHPKVLKLMSKIADAFGEDKFRSPGGNGDMGMTPDEADAKIKEVYANPNHAYFNKNNPQHQQAREQMSKYHEAKLAGKKR